MDDGMSPEPKGQARGAAGANLQVGGARRARGSWRVADIVRGMKEDAELAGRIRAWHVEAARPGQFSGLPQGLDPRLQAVLKSRGIEELYTHQRAAIEAALRGEDVLVSTPTASGKTVCYTLPILQSLLESKGAARALLLFPTKALSQDQNLGLERLLLAAKEVDPLFAEVQACTYDGDTPPAVRRSLRDNGHLVLSNPWMLHQGILPNHVKWASLFRELRYIVVDELHTLAGVFGSSVANVLRRLLRIADHYGAKPRFLASSATLRDAGEHARKLFGREVTVIDEDGSPAGARYFAVYNPPIVHPQAGLRANALEEARALARHLACPKHQTIFFCRRRTAVEVLTRYLKEAAPSLGMNPDEIRGYRGGYLPQRRREIEEGLKKGTVKVVVSTNALELGVDIGELDVCVLVGYPGTQASFWQRAGRVGRRGQESLVVQIARSDPMDQYLAQQPQSLFRAARERLALDPDNLVILSEQLKCAAFELPFEVQDEEGEARISDVSYGAARHASEILDYLAEESGFLHRKGGEYRWMADSYPAQDVTLIGNEPDNVLILDIDSGKAIGETDRESSIETVYEGAIYQVEGETWRSERFDYKNRRAYVRKVDSDYFTDAQTATELRVLEIEEQHERWREGEKDSGQGLDYGVARGEVHVTTVATLFKKIRFYTRENVGAGEIHLPPEEVDTECFALFLANSSAEELQLGEHAAAWRALGRLLRRVAPLLVRCQPSDLGLSSQIKGPHFDCPTIWMWDRVMGGVGLGQILFEEHRALLDAAHAVVAGCDCEVGCPACVGTRAEVGPSGKAHVRALLEHMLGGEAPRLVEERQQQDEV
ncbi:MAG: ATP-dependent helicase [Planctomycetota bacterium]|nr:MAG: ATP-dependent helicase [Planctomycetota bacterium]